VTQGVGPEFKSQYCKNKKKYHYQTLLIYEQKILLANVFGLQFKRKIISVNCLFIFLLVSFFITFESLTPLPMKEKILLL
jgi:hypothetical protein